MTTMKKILLTTVTAASLAGFTAMASAQAPDTKSGGGAAKPAGGMEEKAAPAPSGGAMKQQPSAPAAHSAQGAEPGGKPSAQPEQRMGQEQKPQATPQRGAQEERQEHNGMQQKGAQDERSTQQKGAQEERSAQPKSAQTESTTKSNVSESNKPNAGASAGKGGERGANVQLSSDQRTKIRSVIAGSGHPARVSTSEHFDVSVGVKVPRNVHIEVIPDDVVEIVPEYRGFDYVMVGDEILIIDPDTLEIVAVINA